MTDRSETLIRLLEDSRQPARCRGCDAAIAFYATLTDRRMPMNAGAVPRRVEPDASGRVVAFFAAADSHWVTCPRSADFGRRAGRKG